MLHSTCLPSGRLVTVSTPPGYDATRPARYPLLILHDGQNLFQANRAHVKGEYWRVAETAESLITAGHVEPIVIAGIDHAQTNRIAEFTPTSGGRQNAGQARAYVDMIIGEALPLLRADYALRIDAASTGLGGSSLGGLVTLYIAAMHPGVFGRLLVMSPSVWWDRRVILRLLRRRPIDPATRIWLDIGLNEGARTVADARRVRDALRGLLESPEMLHYEEDPDGDHSERAWADRFGNALAFLYPPTHGLAEG